MACECHEFSHEEIDAAGIRYSVWDCYHLGAKCSSVVPGQRLPELYFTASDDRRRVWSWIISLTKSGKGE